MERPYDPSAHDMQRRLDEALAQRNELMHAGAQVSHYLQQVEAELDRVTRERDDAIEALRNVVSDIVMPACPHRIMQAGADGFTCLECGEAGVDPIAPFPPGTSPMPWTLDNTEEVSF